VNQDNGDGVEGASATPTGALVNQAPAGLGPDGLRSPSAWPRQQSPDLLTALKVAATMLEAKALEYRNPRNAAMHKDVRKRLAAENFDWARAITAHAKGIEAGTAETPQEVRSEGREPGPKGSPETSPKDELIAELVAGHWETPAGAQMAADYLAKDRADLCIGHLPDMVIANGVFMASRDNPDLIAWQTAAKERIRWLSAQLAKAKGAQ